MICYILANILNLVKIKTVNNNNSQAQLLVKSANITITWTTTNYIYYIRSIGISN